MQRAGIRYQSIPAGQVAGIGLAALPKNLLKVIQGTLAARRILNDFQPDVLLFTGGYVAVPMAVAAAVRHIPSLVYVPDIEPGIALKLLARFATLLALTAEETCAFFSAKRKMVVTGYPTRPDLTLWTREAAQTHLGLAPDIFTVLITGGSKGARTINRPVLALLPELLKEMQVIHLTGQVDWQEVEAARAQMIDSLPAEIIRRYHPIPYLHEMGAALAAADLAVSRAGASALGEYPLFGLPAVLVPYPYAWRYQKVNAHFLEKHGAALTIENEHLTEQLMPTLQGLARDPLRLQAMRQAMTSLAQPQAAEHLADLVRVLAHQPTHSFLPPIDVESDSREN